MSALETDSASLLCGDVKQSGASKADVRHWQTAFSGPVEKCGNVLTVVKTEIPAAESPAEKSASTNSTEAGLAEGVEKHGNVLTAPKQKQPVVWNVAAKGFVPGRYSDVARHNPSSSASSPPSDSAITKVGNVLAVSKSVVAAATPAFGRKGSPKRAAANGAAGAPEGSSSSPAAPLVVEKHGGVLSVSRDQLKSASRRRSSDAGNKVVVRKHGNVLAVTRDKPPKSRGGIGSKTAASSKAGAGGGVGPRYRGAKNVYLSRKPGEVVLVGRRTASEASSCAADAGQSWNSPALFGGDVKKTTNFYRANVSRNADKFKNRTVILVGGGPSTRARVPGENRLDFVSPTDGQVSEVGKGLYDTRKRRPLVFQPQETSGGQADWSNIPVTFMNMVVGRMRKATVRVMRSVCQEWKDRIDTSLGELVLKPQEEVKPAVVRSKFPFLRSLSLAGRDLNDPHFLKALLPLQCLATLDLSNTKGLNAFQLLSIAEPLRLGLARLDLSGAEGVDDIGLEAVMQLTNLRILSLARQERVTDKGIETICAGTVKLESIDISCCPGITDAGIKILACKLPCLTELDASKNSSLTFESLEEFETGVASLASLGIHDCDGVTSQAMKFAAKIKSLKHLKFSFTPSTPIWSFAENWTGSGLSISVKCEFPEKLGGVICGLKKLRGVESFVFEGGVISAECLKELSGWEALKGVSTLKLDPARTTGLLNSDINALAESSILRSLSLSRFDGVDLDFLSKLSFSSEGLEELSLPRCADVDSSCIPIICNMKNLRKLGLSHCLKISEEGIQQLKKLPALVDLDLSYVPEMTDVALSGLRDCPKLERLNISYCGSVHPKGIMRMAQVPSLTEIVATGCEKLTDLDAEFLNQFYSQARNTRLLLEM